MRWTKGSAALTALVLLAAGCGSDDGGGGAAAGAGLDTIEQGKLKVAVQSYAPYTTLRGNRIEGLDGDIIHAVADKLGLEVQPQLTDFNGMLGGVQSRRVDITVGGVAWSEERQKEGLFTDPPYYSPPAMGVHSGETYSTVDDLEGCGSAPSPATSGSTRSKRSPTPSSARTRMPTACSTTSAPAAWTSASSTRC